MARTVSCFRCLRARTGLESVHQDVHGTPAGHPHHRALLPMVAMEEGEHLLPVGVALAQSLVAIGRAGGNSRSMAGTPGGRGPA